MPRVTAAEVEEIIEVDDDAISMTPFIRAANLLVNRHCETATDLDGNAYYVSDELKEIELWLSAHNFAIREARNAAEGVSGGPSETKQSKVDLGFDVTHYGQMAMRLDSAGGLARLNALAKSGKLGGSPQLHWGGTDLDNVDAWTDPYEVE